MLSFVCLSVALLTPTAQVAEWTVARDDIRWKTPATIGVYIDMDEEERSLLRALFNRDYGDLDRPIGRDVRDTSFRMPTLSGDDRKRARSLARRPVDDWAALLSDVEVIYNPGPRRVPKCTAFVTVLFDDVPLGASVYPEFVSLATIDSAALTEVLDADTEIVVSNIRMDPTLLDTPDYFQTLLSRSFGFGMGGRPVVPPIEDITLRTYGCLFQQAYLQAMADTPYIGPAQVDVAPFVQRGMYEVDDERLAQLPLHYLVEGATAPPPPERKTAKKKRKRRAR